MDTGITTIRGGGGKPVTLDQALIDLKILSPDTSKGFIDRLNMEGIREIFSLDKPLGRHPSSFWMDLLTTIMPQEFIEDPFSRSGLISLGMKMAGGYEKEDTIFQKNFDHWTEATYGIYKSARIVPADGVFRHYTSAEGLSNILTGSSLVAGYVPYARVSGFGCRSYYPDNNGIFLTLPDIEGPKIGVDNNRVYFIDLTLPEGAPILSMERSILLLMGPSNTTAEIDGALVIPPHPALTVPVEIRGIGTTEGGPLLDIISKVRPEWVDGLRIPGINEAGALAATTGQTSLADGLAADLLGGSVSTNTNALSSSAYFTRTPEPLTFTEDVQRFWRDIVERASKVEKARTAVLRGSERLR